MFKRNSRIILISLVCLVATMNESEAQWFKRSQENDSSAETDQSRRRFVRERLLQKRSHKSSTNSESGSLQTPDGRTRTYLIHVPPGYNKQRLYPLILSFHGTGGQGAGQEKLSHFSTLADREGFIVVYPDGIHKEWNDGRGDSHAEKEGIDDVQFVSLLIDHLIVESAVDPKRIYANGMSNGASFSHRLSCELSNKISGIGGVGSELGKNLSTKCNPERGIPVITFHGTADPFSPYEGGKGSKGAEVLGAEENAFFHAQKNGCAGHPAVENLPNRSNDGTNVTKISYTGCQNKADVVLYKINEGGHTWPGGNQYLPARTIGKTTRDINASELMWEFFKGR